MIKIKSSSVLALFLVLASFTAQTQAPKSTAKPPKPARVPYYLDAQQLDLSPILPPPPAQNSAATQAELAEIHSIEKTRTPAQVAAAESDDHSEDIFLYASVLGPSFTPESLPLTAALSTHVRNDASILNAPLKAHFARPRPYNFDASLHPICDTNQENAYPSGHALNGYLLAFTLIQLVPEKSAEILARADAYAHNRIICEAHYPSDLEASRRVAYVAIGDLLATPRFQTDLAAARTELRTRLALPPAPSH
jgi:acid phosphatase (class A)